LSTKAKLATVSGTTVADNSSLLGRGLEGERHVPSMLRRVRWRRLVKLSVLAVAILIASYLAVANVLLRTSLLRNAISGSSLNFAISGNSTELKLDYESAYSILPGRVHLKGLTIRGRERTVEWLLTLDRADAAISLVDLLHREFHAKSLRASGLTMRARIRLDRVAATPEVTAALPPIAGFADPPLLDEGPTPPPLTDGRYNLWMVDLEDVDVNHVREVWIHTVRSEGDTRVRGRWLFRPQRWLDVGPATVNAEGVDISYGSHPLATGVRGSLDATVHPFDLRPAADLTIVDHVSSRGQLRGYALVADALRLLAPRSGVGFKRWEGPFDARVVLDHGKLADGTRIRNDAAHCEIGAKRLTFEAPIRTELGVYGDVVTIAARASGLRVLGAGASQARVASIAATLTSKHVRVAEAFGDSHFSLDVVGAEAKDIGAWEPYFPSTSTYVVRSGTVTVDGHAAGSVAERRGHAELQLSARRLAVERGPDQLTADVTGDVQLREVSLSSGSASGIATIAANDVTARLGGALLAGNLAAHVDLQRGTWDEPALDLSGSDVVLRAVSARSGRNGVAIVAVPELTVRAQPLALAPSGASGHISIDLPGAELPALARLRELLPLPMDVSIEDGSGRARLHADVELGSGSMRGDGEVVAQGLRARVGSTEFFGDVDCLVRAQRTERARGSTDLSGSTLAVTHAGTGSRSSPEDAWWANVTLREAALRSRGDVRLDAKVHLAAKDATPATVLVSQNTDVPTWVANIFRMPVLDADAQIRVGPASVEVRSLLAHGGSSSLRAEYAKRDGRQEGAVLADLGWIDLGYDLADGGSGLVLFGPDAWYARKTAGMRDAAEAAKRRADAAEQRAQYCEATPAQRKEEARSLAARCTLDARSCDGASIGNLLRAAADARERDDLSGIAYAPMVVAAAKGGKDGTTLDPLVVGSVAEAMRMGGEATLGNIPSIAHSAVASDSDAARGKVIAVTGLASPIRREGSYSVGALTTDAGPVYVVTPFATSAVPEAPARFRGVFVQLYASTNPSQGQTPSLVLVGAFGR